MPITTESVFQKAHHGDHAFEMRRKSSFSKLTGGNVQRPMAGMYAENIQPLQPQKSKIFGLMPNYTPTDPETVQKSIVNHVEYTLARTRFNFGDEDCYRAAAYSLRDRLIETMKDTQQFFYDRDVKRCYYLSLEFLMGRSMQNTLVNLDIEDSYKRALADLGYNLEALYEHEHDAALGNGGLGRLAACFLDSMATLNYACWGYGIRYTYGIFEQKIVNGRQVEHPDYWLVQDNPWEICRHDITYAVRFYGDAHEVRTPEGRIKYKWTGGQLVQAIAYDNPVPGFDTYNCINLRLWKAAPSREFDFSSFNAGRYLDAISERQDAECISAVLYPNDESEQGKLLRIKQQYFFCCATMQDVLRRFKLKKNREWKELPEKMAIQLNDTHPTVAIPELMRILIDIEELEWDLAWDLTKQVFSYTNHTVLPEALEKWSVDLFGKLLPRHVLIINEINFRFLTGVRKTLGDVYDKISKMSIYAEGWQKQIRMANLAVIGSRKVNGVAAIHSDLVKRDLFPEFVEYYDRVGEKDKFINVTNGVTPRRWVHCANRLLSDLFSEWLGSDEWLKNFDMLRGLMAHIDDPKFLEHWQDVKLKNKRRLARHIESVVGVATNPETMLFDVQVKRIHEYKRQTLNLFYMIHRYLTVKRMSSEERKRLVPRCTMVGGKAAPGYAIAKTIIKMINNISCLVNSDPEVSQYYKVIYIPNYNVSQAQIIIPGADLNHQISTAGTEASGTSNMKFVMNGSLIIGTLDGATVEIREEGGDETVFLFGAREQDVERVRSRARDGRYPIDHRLAEVFTWIRHGNLSLGDGGAQGEFVSFVDRLLNNGYGHNGDFYLVCHDFADYCRAQNEVDTLYKDQEKWTKVAVKAASAMGKFTTDRTIEEYAQNIWSLQPAERPPPSASSLSDYNAAAAAARKPMQAPDSAATTTKTAAMPPATAAALTAVTGASASTGALYSSVPAPLVSSASNIVSGSAPSPKAVDVSAAAAENAKSGAGSTAMGSSGAVSDAPTASTTPTGGSSAAPSVAPAPTVSTGGKKSGGGKGGR